MTATLTAAEIAEARADIRDHHEFYTNRAETVINRLLDALEEAGRALKEAKDQYRQIDGYYVKAMVRGNQAEIRAEKAESSLAASDAARKKAEGERDRWRVRAERSEEEADRLLRQRNAALDDAKWMREAAEHVIISWQLEQDAVTFKPAMDSFIADLVTAIQPSALCPAPRAEAEAASAGAKEETT